MGSLICTSQVFFPVVASFFRLLLDIRSDEELNQLDACTCTVTILGKAGHQDIEQERYMCLGERIRLGINQVLYQDPMCRRTISEFIYTSCSSRVTDWLDTMLVQGRKITDTGGKLLCECGYRCDSVAHRLNPDVTQSHVRTLSQKQRTW